MKIRRHSLLHFFFNFFFLFKFLQGDPAKATANYLSILPKESCTGLASVWFVFRSLLVLQCLCYGGFIELKAVSKKLGTCLSGGALPLVALRCSKPGEHAKCGKRCTLFPFTVHTEKPLFFPCVLVFVIIISISFRVLCLAVFYPAAQVKPNL